MSSKLTSKLINTYYLYSCICVLLGLLEPDAEDHSFANASNEPRRLVLLRTGPLAPTITWITDEANLSIRYAYKYYGPR